jgi:hypothetical protein
VDAIAVRHRSARHATRDGHVTAIEEVCRLDQEQVLAVTRAYRAPA